MEKKIRVLGVGGCKTCSDLAEKIRKMVAEHGISAIVEKVENPMEFITCKVLKTPGVVVDGVTVHSGSVPTEEEILSWIS